MREGAGARRTGSTTRQSQAAADDARGRRGIGYVVWVPSSRGARGHFKTRVRFSSERPWVHLPSVLAEGPARACAAELARCAREGFAVEWIDGVAGQPGRWGGIVELTDNTLARGRLDRATNIDEALARAAEYAQRVRTKGYARAVGPVDGETCSAWWERYLAHREAKGQASVKDARARVVNWVLPLIGAIPIRVVTREDLERVVRALDVAVRNGDIEWKTAENIWGEVTSAFRQASTSKDPALRVREDNPAANVQGPDRGIEKDKPILYPDEAIALLASERVPLNRRIAYAFAIYTGARANELAALTAEDVDLAHGHGRIAIARQVDRNTGGDRQTKTKKARSIDIEPALLPLVRALVASRSEGRLLHLPPDEDRAELLRKDLKTAGVMRADLFVKNDPSREWIKFHNLRDTCLTWMAVRGDSAPQIQHRAGHSDYAMTQKYTAAGMNLRRALGVPFPPLPRGLVPGRTDPATDDENPTSGPTHEADTGSTNAAPAVTAAPDPAGEQTIARDVPLDGDAAALSAPAFARWAGIGGLAGTATERLLDHYWTTGKTKALDPLGIQGFEWRPQRDLNPCYRRERPMS